MAKRIVIINPSHQLHNECILGDTEAKHCKPIAQKVYNVLKSVEGIDKVYLIGDAPSSENTERKRLYWSIAESNKIYKKYSKSDDIIHVAIHTNAPASSTDNSTRGVEVFSYGNTKGVKLAKSVYNELTGVFPVHRNAKINKALAELNGTLATACIAECGFHTNKDDAKIIHEVNAVACALINGILWYYSIQSITDTEDYKAKYEGLVKDIKAVLAKYEA